MKKKKVEEKEAGAQDSTIEVLNSVIQVFWHLRVHISLLVLEARW